MFCSACFDYMQGFFELIERTVKGKLNCPIASVLKCHGCTASLLHISFVSDYKNCCKCRDDGHCLGCTNCTSERWLQRMRERVERSIGSLVAPQPLVVKNI